ncbi:MAG: hypothetical protein QM811_14600 [Pirellulales bacterium]
MAGLLVNEFEQRLGSQQDVGAFEDPACGGGQTFATVVADADDMNFGCRHAMRPRET